MIDRILFAVALTVLLSAGFCASGCAATHADPVELACENYVDTLACNPSPEFSSPPPAFTHEQCVLAFAKGIPSDELECFASIARCTDAPTCGVAASPKASLCDVPARDDSLCEAFWVKPQWLAMRWPCDRMLTQADFAAFDEVATYLDGTNADGVAPQSVPPSNPPPVIYLHSRAPVALESFAPRALADRCLLTGAP